MLFRIRDIGHDQFDRSNVDGMGRGLPFENRHLLFDIGCRDVDFIDHQHRDAYVQQNDPPFSTEQQLASSKHCQRRNTPLNQLPENPHRRITQETVISQTPNQDQNRNDYCRYSARNNFFGHSNSGNSPAGCRQCRCQAQHHDLHYDPHHLIRNWGLRLKTIGVLPVEYH